MLKYLHIIFFWFTFYTVQSLPQVLSTEKLYQKVLPSITTLEVKKNNGDMVLGTAFLIKSDGIAVTCFHVIKDAKVVKAKFSDGEEFLASGIIDKDEKRDLAIIKIKCFKEKTLPLSKVEPKVGAPAYVIGSPKGLEFSISDGIISQIQTIEGSQQYQFTCPASPGNSGGPLLNNNGEVIGVVSWQVSQGQNLNFAVPSSYVLGLDQSLPTTPWLYDSYTPDATKINALNEDYLVLIANLHLNISDQATAITEVYNTMVIVDNGFQKTITPDFYRSFLGIKSTLNKMANISTQDPILNKIGSTMVSNANNIIRAAETLREAIDVAKSNDGWTDKANDLLSQSSAYYKLCVGLTEDMRSYLSKSDAFISSLTDDKRINFVPNLEIDFLLGVNFYSYSPTKFIVVEEEGLAYDLGFIPFDEILSVNSVPVESLIEIKKNILNNRGGFVTFEIWRDGENKTFTREIPKDLSKYKD